MSPLKQWRILVVEDEPDGQMVVSSLLSYFNIATEPVGTAEEALQLLAKEKFQCAVIDLMLPGMDGLTLVKRIRDTQSMSRMPCVAITAFHTSAVRQQAIDSGFDAYFPKPLDDTSFVRALESLVEGEG